MISGFFGFLDVWGNFRHCFWTFFTFFFTVFYVWTVGHSMGHSGSFFIQPCRAYGDDSIRLGSIKGCRQVFYNMECNSLVLSDSVTAEYIQSGLTVVDVVYLATVCMHFIYLYLFLEKEVPETSRSSHWLHNAP